MSPLTREQMVREILICMRANSIPTTGDVYFTLIFRTDGELRSICRELHINTEGHPAAKRMPA